MKNSHKNKKQRTEYQPNRKSTNQKQHHKNQQSPLDFSHFAFVRSHLPLSLCQQTTQTELILKGHNKNTNNKQRDTTKTLEQQS